MPNDSFIRFELPSERERFLPILIEIYSYESTKISGSSGGVRRFSDCIWTRNEMLGAIKNKIKRPLPALETDFDDLIDLMSDPDKRHMMRFKINDQYHHITRLAELIRTTSCLHEYTNREVASTDSQGNAIRAQMKFPIIDGVRWEPRLRYGASRSISPNQIIQFVRAEFDPNHNLPNYLGGHHIDVAIDDLTDVLEAANHVIANGNLKFSEFQKDSIVQAFKNSWSSSSNTALVITAGTGMGKTLGFTIPVITDALICNRSDGPKCSQLLMYPRNDLAKDQFEQITNIVKRLNHTFATNGTPERCLGTALDADGRISNPQDNYPTSGNKTVPWGIGYGNRYKAAVSTYSGDNPASIVACSIESFRRRLRIPEVCSGLGAGLRRIVLDEVHLSNGIQGGHHSRILSRCRQLLYTYGQDSNPLTFIGVSATIAKPREHISKIWFSVDERAKDVDHVDSEALDRSSPMGIRHNVMVRPRKGSSPIGTLVDMTSAVTHQRRSRDFYNRPTTGNGYDYQSLQKTVGFADSHEIVGNWYSYLLDNESTSRANRLEASRRRPYAHWHDRPLSLQPGGDKVCESCQTLNHHTKPIKVPEDSLGQFVYDPDLNNPDDSTIHSWQLPLYPPGCGEQEITGLETCHHLQSGTCWWFSPRTSVSEPRPGHPGFTSYRDVIRAKRHTGKTNSGRREVNPGEAKADYSFKEQPRFGAYPGPMPDNPSTIPHDIAIATPTLEVGVDMANVSDVLTHKAIRNVSSYRQKVGRAGREPGTDALAMTLMSLRRQEFQYYRSMFRLVDAEILDAVPVANNNLAMKKHQAYESIFDYLAKLNHDIEYIPGLKQPSSSTGPVNDAAWNNLDNIISDAVNAICIKDAAGNFSSIKVGCDNYIKYSVNINDGNIREEAARVAVKHLEYFLESMPVSTPTNNVSVIQYLSSKNKGIALNAGVVNIRTWKTIKTNISSYETEIMPVSTDQAAYDKYISELLDCVANYDGKEFSIVLSNMDSWVKIDPVNRVEGEDLVAILERLVRRLAPVGRIHRICTQVKILKNYKETRYLSMVMMNCPIFLEDTPYAPLATLFQNPHEQPLEARMATNNGVWTEYLTAKEGLRYGLPGMWTHRLFRGSRVFINHRGETTLSPHANGILMLHLDGGDNCPELEYKGALTSTDIARISPMLELKVDVGTTMHKLLSINASRDIGVSGRPNSVFQGTPPYKGLYYNMDDPSKGDVSDGAAGQMIRPRAHSINWQLSNGSEHQIESRTYKIAETKRANSSDPDSLPVVEHPLLSKLFRTISYDQKLNIKRLALGVSRSNLVVLQNYHNEGKSVIVDSFETNGFRFTIKPEMIAKVRSMGSRIDHPFDERVVRMIGAWMLKDESFQINSFLLEMFLDLMVNEAWIQSNSKGQKENEFPETINQFVELLFNSGNTWDANLFLVRVEQDAIATDYTGDEALVLLDIYNEFVKHQTNIKDNFQSMMADWYQEVFLNTLGLTLSESVAQFAGVTSDAVSYTFTISPDGEELFSIDVFDDDAEGNGSTELANKFFHIPIEVRELAQHFDDTNLPTSSFVDVIEDRLRMCEEHILHSISLSGKTTSGIPRWMHKESTELRNRFSTDRWTKLGIDSTRVATLQNRRRFAYVDSSKPDYRTELVNWDLSLSLCDVDCPACNGDDFGNLFPPHLVMYTTCRAVIDETLGDWANYQGYLNKNGDRHRIQLMSGDDVDSGSFIHVVGKKPGSLPIRQRFVMYPSPAIGLAWQRYMQVPDFVDKYVRHQEVL